MRLPYVVLVCGSLALAACDRAAEKPRTADLGTVMPTVLFPPEADFVSKSAGPDAIQLVFQSRMAPAEVADYYRRIFVTGKWRLVGDSRDSTGGIALYAEQDGPPMWVRIGPSGPGSRVELSGASSAVDTAFARRAQRARDTTNTLMPR